MTTIDFVDGGFLASTFVLYIAIAAIALIFLACFGFNKRFAIICVPLIVIFAPLGAIGFVGAQESQSKFVAAVEDSYSISLSDSSKALFNSVRSTAAPSETGKPTADRPLNLLFSYEGQDIESFVYIVKDGGSEYHLAVKDGSKLIPLEDFLTSTVADNPTDAVE